eukprot:gnl/Trimastix_PCT/3820.p1 GENE.gnl/Trimastix_PCT/3820~~gnl/Trimastix_PCT/3820.p1  ORF type:complete len:195 (+),score=7.70 gnl/Trimastix_PCT/3820:15-599(+)
MTTPGSTDENHAARPELNEPVTMRLSLEYYSKVIPLNADFEPSDSVETLKRKIHDQVGIPPHEQQLRAIGHLHPDIRHLALGGNGFYLDDDNHTLADYQLADNSTIILHRLGGITLNCKVLDYKDFSIEFHPSMTVDDLKSFLQLTHGLNVRFQRIVSMKLKRSIDNGTMTLEECGVQDGDTLFVVSRHCGGGW